MAFKTENPKVPRSFDLLIYNREEVEGGFQRGDIVDYFIHPQLGPHAHAGGKFHVITVRNVTEEDIQRWMEPELESYERIKPSSAMPIPSGIMREVKRRARFFDIAKLGLIERNRLAARERIELPTRQLVQQRITTKKGGATEI